VGPGQPLQPTGSELTYINFISIESATGTFAMLETVLRDPIWSRHERFLPVPSRWAHNYGFDMPNGRGVLQASAGTAQRKDGAPALKLELTVRGKQMDEVTFEQWASDAHDFLVAAFKDLTQPAMHAAWKLREE
jgi:uncharacterized protein (TIGR04255 family)